MNTINIFNGTKLVARLVVRVIKLNPSQDIKEAVKPAKKAVKTPKKATKKAKQDKIVKHRDIIAKWDNPESVKYNFNADINLTKQEIRIFGHYQSYNNELKGTETVEFDRTFRVGDEVETGSYNLIYTHPITGFTATRVKCPNYDSKTLDLYKFISRNKDLDLELIAEKNMDTSYYI